MTAVGYRAGGSMTMRWAALCVVATVLALAGFANAKVVEHDFEVAYVDAAPDCYAKTVIGINGVYPGPTIRAVQGDILKITFHNYIATEGITMHWHGIRQVLALICRSLSLQLESCHLTLDPSLEDWDVHCVYHGTLRRAVYVCCI